MLDRLMRYFGWSRCQFCAEFTRTASQLRGVCRGCADEALAWLADLGCTVTWERGGQS